MELARVQYERIAPLLPRQRGNVSLSSLQALSAILCAAEHGCQRRGLPARFGSGHTLCTRMSRRPGNGGLDRALERLQRERMIRIRVEVLSLGSARIKAHPDGTGALRKTAPSASASPGAGGTPSFIWLPRMTGAPRPSRALPAARTMPRRGGGA